MLFRIDASSVRRGCSGVSQVVVGMAANCLRNSRSRKYPPSRYPAERMTNEKTTSLPPMRRTEIVIAIEPTKSAVAAAMPNAWKTDALSMPPKTRSMTKIGRPERRSARTK